MIGSVPRMRWATIIGMLFLAATSWGANRLDIFTVDPGDRDSPFDDWAGVAHMFVSEDLQPWQLYLYVDSSFNAIDPAVNANGVSTWDVILGVREAARAWNDVSISAFEFEDEVVPFDHTFTKFPNQTLIPGATGLDGWNLVTFQDPMMAATTGTGVASLTVSWVFWQDYDLSSFIKLPPGVIIVNPPGTSPPPGGAGSIAQIDFDLDGIPDVILDTRKYHAGEVIEADVWLSQIQAWHQWPQDPDDLPSTPGGTVSYLDTIGTLDIQATVLQELGHIMGVAYSNLERATMYPFLKGPYSQGFRYPTDIYDMRELDLDDEVAASLLYPKRDRSRGAIAGRVLDGRNFDGVPDYTSGVIDAVLYGTLYVCREMSTDTIPAYVPDKLLFTTTTAGLTQEDLDTSPALWLEFVTEIQTGDAIRMADWPNPASLLQPSTIGGQRLHMEAAPDYHIPGLPPYDRYILYIENTTTYANDSAGVATDNISEPFNFFSGWQPIPAEFYGGCMDLATRAVLGADGPTTLGIASTQPLVLTGDDPTSYVYVAVHAGEITAGIDIYTNTGGLPPGVTPTPLPGVTPTPPPIGNTRFKPDEAGDPLVPEENEFGVAGAVGDIDNDSDLDLFICNAMSGLSGAGSPAAMINRLYLNDLVTTYPGGPLVRKFVDVTFGPDNIQGTDDDRLPMHQELSFGAAMADFNLDGFVDIFVCNAETLRSPHGAQNRLYLNRGAAQPGWFDDVTTAPRPDTPGIPTSFTQTILPGILNTGPFNPYPDPMIPYMPADFNYLDWLDRSGKPAVGDIDADGDVDIVIANMNLFPDVAGSWSPETQDFYLYFSERILINHANDFDPDTRGFYFTDETLGLDCRFGEATHVNFPAPATWTPRQAADRLSPCYPDLPPTDANEGEFSRSFKVVLAPLFSDASLDLIVFNRRNPPWTSTRDGFDAIFKNVDVDGDGVQDGYFRLMNAGGGEYGYMTVHDAFGTTIPNLFAMTTETGTGGIGIFDGDPGDGPDSNAVQFTQNDAFGGCVADFNYHGFNLPIAVDGTNGHILYDVGGAGATREGSVFGGQGLMYGAWATMNVGTGLAGFRGFLARDAVAADFDADGDFDVYVGFQKSGIENFISGPVANQYFVNGGWAAFTDATAVATSGSSRGTYDVLAFDFENDGDLDVFQVNGLSQNALVLNQIFDGKPDLTSRVDNPLFFDVTPQFLPPYYFLAANPPWTLSAGSNMSVNAAAGDLNSDDLPDLVVACGGLFTVVGDDTDVLLNHGQPMNQGTPVMSPLHATWPAPKIASFEWYRRLRYFANFDFEYDAPYDVYRLNVYKPAYDVALADFDLDGDYDVFLSTLGTGPLLYSNEDSADVLVAWDDVLSVYGFTERALNSIPDQDFLGDGILIPAGTTGSLMMLPALTDPGGSPLGTVKKDQNRGIAVGDVDNNGSIDVVIANGIPLAGGAVGGAPNVLLLNGVRGDPLGTFWDATEANLPVVRMSDGMGGYVYEGINDDTLGCALADFDSDGDLDLIFANVQDGVSSPTRYLVNTGGGHFVDAPGFLPASFTSRIGSPWSIVVADFDRKGDPTEDVNGNGVLDPGEDTNHNGVLDWWDTTETEDINGNGVLDPGEDGLAPFGPPNGVLDSADLNGDGEITARQPGVFDASWDVFISFQDGPDVLLLNSLPGPQFYFVDASNLLPQLWVSSYGADVGDVDLDGDVDILVGIKTNAPDSGRVVLYLNRLNDPEVRGFTNAGYEIPRAWSVAPAAGYGDWFHTLARDVELADFDLDGDLDLFVSYTGFQGQPGTEGGMNVVYLNRAVPQNWNNLNKFRTYRSPFLVKLSPDAGCRGRTIQVTFVGENIESGITTVDMGEGVELAGPIARLGPNIYTAPVAIDGGAPLGPHDVTIITNEGKMAQLYGAFKVLATDTAARSSWRLYR